MSPDVAYEIRRAEERFHTDDVNEGTETFHSFSYGQHYDPDRIGFGPIMAINEERLAPGARYDEHRHADVEIVTFVIDGSLEHRDSTGVHGIIQPGMLQRLSAGSGVTHTEANASATEPLHFLQVMVRSDHDGDPEYAQVALSDDVDSIPLHAPLAVRVLSAGHQQVAAQTLVHVVAGDLLVGLHVLSAGDELTVTQPVDLTLTPGAQALAWTMRSSRGAIA